MNSNNQKLTDPQRRVLTTIARLVSDRHERAARLRGFLAGAKTRKLDLRDDETYVGMSAGCDGTPAAVVHRLAALGMIELRRRREVDGQTFDPDANRYRKRYRTRFIARLTAAGREALSAADIDARLNQAGWT